MIILILIAQILSKENAVILILCRNSDLKGIIKSITNLEDVFNKKYNYPYVFLNDQEFTNQFKEEIKKIVKNVEFGLIPKDHWNPPEWIDIDKVNRAMKEMREKKIVHGGTLSYRNMCRFFSGFFYKHKLVQKYDYYWRVEPNVKYFCDIDYDPFEYMRKNDKLYGFIISTYEIMETIPSLWKVTKQFLIKNANLLENKKLMKFIFNKAKEFNGCHFWSNFEIASFELFRNQIYDDFFNFLDHSGGFYYERWGDAPVHTLATILFLDKSQIHHFDDIGYQHDLFSYCPVDKKKNHNCRCDPKTNFDEIFAHMCLKNYKREMAGEKLIEWNFLPHL